MGLRWYVPGVSEVIGVGKAVGKAVVKTGEKLVDAGEKIIDGVGDIISGDVGEGFKKVGSGVISSATAPVTTAVNAVENTFEAVALKSDIGNAFFATVLGRDYQKQHDVLANVGKSEDCIEQLNTLATKTTNDARDAIRTKVRALVNVKGFTDYVSKLDENIFDQYFDYTSEMLKDFASGLGSAVGKIVDYSNADGLEKLTDTTIMAGTKFAQGVAGVFEDIGDAGITALNWVGLIDDDIAEYAVGMEWSKDNALSRKAIEVADMSAFTEDSFMAGAFELAGEIGCYIVLGEVLAPAGMSSVAAQTVIAGTAGFGSGTESAINQGKSIDQARWTGVKTGATQAAVAFVAGKAAEKVQIKGAQKAADKADDAMRASAESLDDMARAANSVDDASKAMLVDNAQKASDAAHKELDAAKSALEKASGGDAYYKAQENYIKALNKANSADEILNAAKNADDVALYAKNASKQISNAEDLAKAAHEELDVARDALNKASGEGYFKAENAYQKALEKSKAADQFLSDVKNVSTNADDALRAASSADDLAKAAKDVSNAKADLTDINKKIADGEKALKDATKAGDSAKIGKVSDDLDDLYKTKDSLTKTYDDAVKAFEGQSDVQALRANDVSALDDSLKQAQKAENAAQTKLDAAEKDLTKAQNEYVKAAKGNDATAKAEARIKADKAEQAVKDAKSELSKAKANTTSATNARDAAVQANKTAGLDTLDDDIAKAAKERKSAEKAFKKEGTMDNFDKKVKAGDKYDELIAKKASFESDPIRNMTTSIDNVQYADDIAKGTVKVEGYNSDLAKTLRDGDYHGLSGIKDAAKDFHSLSLGEKVTNVGKTMVGANTIFSDAPTAAVAASKAINDYYDKGGTEGFVDRLTAPKINVDGIVDKQEYGQVRTSIHNEIKNSTVMTPTQDKSTPQQQQPQEPIHTPPTGGGDQSGSTPTDNGNSSGGYSGGGYYGGGYSGGGYTGPTGGGATQFKIDTDKNPNVIPEPVTEDKNIPVNEIDVNSDDIPTGPTGGDNPFNPGGGDAYNPSNPGGGDVYNPSSNGGTTTVHTGGGYSRTGGYSGTNNYISTPGTSDTIKNNVTKGKTSVDDIIKGSKYTKIPTNTTPINTKSSSDGLGAVIPIAAGLSAAAAAGIGAKAYLDHKKNNDNDEDDDEFGAEEWNGDEENIEIDYDDSSDTNTEQYLDDDDNYDYQPESEEKYGARNSEELADLQ